MKQFRITIDPTPYTAKPTAEVGAITERLKRAGATSLDYDQFTMLVASGCTWVPGTFGEPKRNDKGKLVWGDFEQLQVFALDFDNDAPVIGNDGKPIKGRKRPLRPGEQGYLNPSAALRRCKSKGLQPFLLYFSFSAKKVGEAYPWGWPRYRLVFDCGEPITGETEARAVIAGVLALFPEADPACKNPNRLFFGSPGAVHTFREVWQ